jgi:hypothetical protein
LHLIELRKKYASVEIELAETKSSLKLNEYANLQNVEKNSFEINNLQTEITRLKREKEIIYSKLRENEIINDNEKKKNITLSSDNSLKITNLKKVIIELKNKNIIIENKFKKSQDFENLLNSEIIILKDTIKNFEKIQNDNQNFIENLKKEFKLQVIEKISLLKKKFKAVLTKEKKKSEVYKNKALQLHMKDKAIFDVAKSLKSSIDVDNDNNNNNSDF